MSSGRGSSEDVGARQAKKQILDSIKSSEAGGVDVILARRLSNYGPQYRLVNLRTIWMSHLTRK